MVRLEAPRPHIHQRQFNAQFVERSSIMATPSIRLHEGMTNFLDALARDLYGRDRTESIKANVCVSCGEPSTYFRDGKSETEYTISGTCQVCQDADEKFLKSLEAESND